MGGIEHLVELVQLPEHLQGPCEINYGGAWVASFHSPHGMGRRADPFSKIFLCQVSASTGKRNRLTEPGQAAFNW